MATTVYWQPSTDSDIASYEVSSAPTNVGAWTVIAATINDAPRTALNGNYQVGPPARFYYYDASGTDTTWYRIRSKSTGGVYGPYSDPALAAQVSSTIQTSEVNVVTMALAQLGETTTVSSILTPTTKAEKLAALFYPRVRDSIFGSHKWSFATRRQALALTSSTRSGWAYVYSLPVDCQLAIALDLGYRNGSQLGDLANLGSTQRDPSWPLIPTARARFAIEASDDLSGRVLCCDVQDAGLAYVARVEDPSLWPQPFTDAVMWGLCARLVMPLAVKPDMASMVLKLADAALMAAIASDENEAFHDPAPDSDFVTGRSW